MPKTKTKTKIAIMGAGAVGCYFGGLLARAGHDVTLIGRPGHVRAIEQNGLHLETRTFDEHVPVSASVSPQAVAGAKWVLFCVKSTDTESAARTMRDYLEPDAIVLALQNGVDNDDRLRRTLTQAVAATVVYVGAEMAGPGHVKHHGRGELIIESMQGSAAIAECFAAAGIPTDISDNVKGALWEKLILNCAYNALSAIAQMPYGPLSEQAGARRVIDDVVAECVSVARAEGVRLPGDIETLVRKLPQAMPAQYSSTAQDIARRKPTEIDHLNGFVVRRGEASGVPVVANRTLHAVVKLLERGF